ncbi:hypothetical protein Y032_0010g1207 [Ancylostoma ceylanicum]|nr:hypothetical protein Y032_0010g1207 [Ancylostoma ceylanicum]
MNLHRFVHIRQLVEIINDDRALLIFVCNFVLIKELLPRKKYQIHPAIMSSTWLVLSLTLLQMMSTSGTRKFGCKNSLISDEWREKVIRIHNDNRRKLAKGKQQGKNGVLPVSTNTQLLHWDCSMEEMAETAAISCPTTPTQPTIPGGNDKFGLTFESTNLKGKECDSIATTARLIKAWWTEGAKKQTNENFEQNNDKFSQMAFSGSKGLGCTYQTCGRQFYVLCLYGEDAVTKAAAANNKLYTASTSNPQINDVCKDCGNNAAGKLECEDALCTPAYTPIVITTGNVCPTCTKDVPEDVRVTALDMHNYYRRLLATGWAEDKKIKYAKPATEMNALVYDKDLEDDAYNFINPNPNQTPNPCPTAPEGNIGESFWSGNYKVTNEEAVKEAMKVWWGPLESTGLGDNLEYTSDRDNGAFKYFANVAHDQTKKVGCAVRTCNDQGITVVDCRYNAAIGGGVDIYKAGKMPCKPCPSGTACSKLGGLCEATP